MRRLTLAPIGCLLAFATPTLAQTESEPVPYPEGYRLWTHVKSTVLFDNHPLAEQFGGIHHVYANALALEGLEEGSFADGAVLVFDLLEATQSEDALSEGTRKRVDVMYRDASEYASTGGWGFESFAGDSRSERLLTDGGLPATLATRRRPIGRSSSRSGALDRTRGACLQGRLAAPSPPTESAISSQKEMSNG